MTRPSTFAAPHKALRSAFCEALTRAGNTDHTNTLQVQKMIGQCRDLFSLLQIHVTDENNIMLAQLDERSAGAGENDRNDHYVLEHYQTKLEEQLGHLANAATAEGMEDFYAGLGKLFGMHLEHMYEEETVTQQLLWDHFTDAELAAMRVRIIQQLNFDQLMTWFKYMFPAMRPHERAGMLNGFLASAPPPVAEKATEVIRTALGDAEWDRTRLLLTSAN